MSEVKSKSYERWDKITRSWWFFLLLILVQLVPAYTTKGSSWSEIGKLIPHILLNSPMMGWAKAYPFFQVAVILCVIGVILLRNRFRKIFSIYAGLSYLLFAVGQNISFTEEYGTAVLTVNIIMLISVAACWFWEAFQGRNDFSTWPRSPWRYWVFIPALFAFWFPMSKVTLGPDFNPIYLLTSGSALTFCMTTPLFLAVLLIHYPNVNQVTLRVTSAVGIIIGIYTLLMNFVWMPALWWNGVIHVPLPLLSIYGLVASLLETTSASQSREIPASQVSS
jgi:hypothetical protein